MDDNKILMKKMPVRNRVVQLARTFSVRALQASANENSAINSMPVAAA
jgi:hypothetical protein